MNALVPLLCALLSQSDPAPAAEAPSAPAERPPAPAPSGAPGVPPGMGRPGGMGNKQLTPDEVTRQLDRIKKMSPEEGQKAAKKFAEDMSQMAGVKLETANESEFVHSEGFGELSDVEQVRVMARIFDNRIVIGDARSLTLLSGFPFQLEDRSLASPDELHGEWLKNLRNKRTDVLTLYGVEVYTPQEMVKKYGAPPPRLAKLPLNAPKTLIAVSNFSGRASISVWRYTGGTWVAVGYTD